MTRAALRSTAALTRGTSGTFRNRINERPAPCLWARIRAAEVTPEGDDLGKPAKTYREPEKGHGLLDFDCLF